MLWQDHVKQRTLAVAEAAKRIKSGDRVVIAHAAASPESLVEAMVNRAHELHDVEVVHMVALGPCNYCRPEFEKSFRYNGIYISGPTRQALADDRADFIPMFFSEFPSFFRSGRFPIDVTLLTVSPPDENGYVSLGVSIDYTREATLRAKTSIAVINPNMPYIKGDALIKVTDIDHFVESDEPILELAPPAIGPVEQAIGNNIAGIIRDGDCLQLGIGAIPDAVLSALTGHKALGIHSEMISDGVMSLMEAGVITGERKNINPGKVAITFAMGSTAFYNWMDHNDAVEGYVVDYINDPRVIGRIDNLMSINSALSVDLLGQVAADTIGTKQYSAVGGQVDFVRGAHHSNGGRSIIAMPSTASKGKVSRICAMLAPGQAVTTSRHDVDTVVTEHGVAELRWKTNRERMRALIAVAAPDFREDLARQARDSFGIRV